MGFTDYTCDSLENDYYCDCSGCSCGGEVTYRAHRTHCTHRTHTTMHAPPTMHCPPSTVHRPPSTAHRSSFTVHRSPSRQRTTLMIGQIKMMTFSGMTDSGTIPRMMIGIGIWMMPRQTMMRFYVMILGKFIDHSGHIQYQVGSLFRSCASLSFSRSFICTPFVQS